MIKNKKGQAMEFLLTYGWAILVILIAVGILSYHGFIKQKFEFDSDKDICTSCVVAIEQINERIISNEHRCNMEVFDECLKHRPKTKCELDPNINFCVCDEYEKKEYECYTASCKEKYIHQDGKKFCNSEDILYLIKYGRCDFRFNETIILNTENCIKSHEPTPCDLGDSEYVEDSAILHESWIDNYNFNPNQCIKVSENRYKCSGCRRVGLMDLSCSSLIRYVFLNKQLSAKIDKTDFRWWWSDYNTKTYSIENIYDTAIIKGCEV